MGRGEGGDEEVENEKDMVKGREIVAKEKKKKKSHTPYNLTFTHMPTSERPVPPAKPSGGKGGIVTVAFFFLLLNYSLARRDFQSSTTT